MGKRPNIYKRKYFIHRKFQLSVLLYAACLVLLTIGTIYVAHLYHYSTLISRGHALGLGEGHIYYKLIREQKEMMSETLAYASLIMTALIGAFSVLISHKVAGPIHRLVKYLEAGATPSQGAPEPLKFRSGDYFLEIPQALNKFISESRRRDP